MSRIKIIGVLVCTLLIATAILPAIGGVNVSTSKEAVEKIIGDFNSSPDKVESKEVGEDEAIITVVGDTPPSETLDICLTFGIDGFGAGTIPFSMAAGDYNVRIGYEGTFIYYYSIRDSEGQWVKGSGLVFNNAHLLGNSWNPTRAPIAGTQIATFVGIGNGVFQICFIPQ